MGNKNISTNLSSLVKWLRVMGTWTPRTDLELETQVWSLQDLYERKKKRRIRIPRFQRGPVWDEDAKRKLINSILNNYPIGALLLFDNGNEVSVIDGLQRIQAIEQFMKTPAIYENSDDFLPDDYWKKVSRKWKQKEKTFKDAVHHLLKEKEHEEIDHLQAYRFQEEIEKYLQIRISDTQRRHLYDDLDSFIQTLSSMYSHVKEYKVPILKVSGDRSFLPTAFELINTRGTPLTKYQIFGATWSDFGVSISKAKGKEADLLDRIVDKVKERYDGWQKANWKLDFDISEIDKNNLSLYEFMLGYSLCLQDAFDYIPGDKNEPEVGFVSMFGYHACKVGTRKSVMGSDFTGIVLDSLSIPRTGGTEKAWKKNCGVISNHLLKVANLFYNAYEQIGREVDFLNKVKISSARSENTLYHMVCMANWMVTRNRSSVPPEVIKQRYVFDIIARMWSGTGDKRLFEQSKQSGYMKKIVPAEWDGIWKTFLREQEHTFDTERKALDNRQRIVLKAVYSCLQNVYQSHSTGIVFEDDHIFPIAGLNLIYETGGPINHIGNRSLIQKDPNRKKGSSLPHEYLRTKSGKTEERELKTFWGLNDNTLWREMTGVSKAIETAKSSNTAKDKKTARAAYLKFIKKRSEQMFGIMSTVLDI
ncbi:MAG: hypothetical protein DRP09_14320 [Candidatus Thorarchaeota archaeon]|nr:MAG: hypothetical protein DRP09_14320 [Candidatus Thorarchaeota archaeon]